MDESTNFRIIKDKWATKTNGPVMPEDTRCKHTEQVQHIQGPNPEPYSIKIERGMKGTYSYEIGVKGSDPLVIIEQIKAIDAQLKKEFIAEA